MDKLITQVEKYTKEESPKLNGAETKLTYAKGYYYIVEYNILRSIRRFKQRTKERYSYSFGRYH